MAGLPQKVIQRAKVKSLEFIGNMRGLKKVSAIQKKKLGDAIYLQADSEEDLPIGELQRVLDSQDDADERRST